MPNHKQIRRFQLNGEIGDDKYFISHQYMYTKLIVEGMNASGYVPVLDLSSDWTTSYNGKTYNFKLSVYGVYVGKRKAQWIEGMLGTNIIQNSKSETPSKSPA